MYFLRLVWALYCYLSLRDSYHLCFKVFLIEQVIAALGKHFKLRDLGATDSVAWNKDQVTETVPSYLLPLPLPAPVLH
jgi:hypothetical protein